MTTSAPHVETGRERGNPLYLSAYTNDYLSSIGIAGNTKAFTDPYLTRIDLMAAPSAYDPKLVEPKWQRVWEDQAVHRARAAPARPKFFACVPYPYMSGCQHFGYGTHAKKDRKSTRLNA